MEVPLFTDNMEMMNDLSLIHHQLQHLQVNSLEELFVNKHDHQVITNQAAQSYKRSVQNDNNVHTLEEKPLKQFKANNWNSSNEISHVLKSHDDLVNNSTMLSFSNNSSCSNQINSGLITPKKEVGSISNEMLVSSSHQQASLVDKQCSNLARVVPQIRSSNLGCTTQQSRDHIIAERKRREKLNQKFIALSSIIHGLKKMDKASVLRDAAKYVKQLQEKVTELEVEAKNKKALEQSAVLKRYYVSVEEDDQFHNGSSLGDGPMGPFPEIEAKIADKDVLIKIHCDKVKGIVENITSKIEELNLVVRSSNSLAFGGSTLAVTIVAQMDAEFSGITAKDVVRHIHPSLKCWT